MHKWHHNQFRMQWPENEPPKWWIDLFIVDTLIREVISNYRNEIRLWRFHRRAARDNSGHQLTLLCYTTQQCSVSIDNVIQESDEFGILRHHDLLKEYIPKDGGSNIEDSSDENWPLEIQKSWPYFIVGVSEMLLELIDLIKRDTVESLRLPPSIEALTDIERLYLKVNERLNVLWRQQGSHAYFHHMNALFGYARLLARPRDFAAFLSSF